MEGASSCDEEDDYEALVPQNEAKSPRRRSTFEIGETLVRTGRSAFWSKKWYFIAISIPILLLLLLYFSLPIGRLFNCISIVTSADSPSNQMRESEPRSLHLLLSQQLELLDLWNRTLAVNSSKFDQLRSVVLDQIKLNQQTLLLAHQTKNSMADRPFDDNVGANLCRRVDHLKERMTIEWKPKKDRFLFAICLSGKMSNHLICLEKHMFFAALLGRLGSVFPSHKLDYHYDEVLDLDHMNKCFDRNVVVSFDEFSVMKKHKLSIDRFICCMASPPCFLDEEHIKSLKDLGISLGKIEAAWPEDTKSKKQKKRSARDITPKFSSDDEVIAIEDMFYVDVEEE